MERVGFYFFCSFGCQPSHLVPRGSAEAGRRQDCVEGRSVCVVGVITATSSLPPCSILTPGLLLAVCWSVLGARVGKEVFRQELPGKSFKPCCVAAFATRVALGPEVRI